VSHLEAVLAHFLEVFLKCRASVMLDYLGPLGRFFKVSQVRFDFARQNFQSGGFAYAVLPQQAQNDSWRRRGQPKKLERVLPKTVAAVFFKLVWKVHYADGFEGAFFDAYAAAAAEHFGNYGFVAFYLYGFHATAHHRAEVDACLIAFFHFAPVGVQYSNSRHGKLEI
jgi:hypothetical protein